MVVGVGVAVAVGVAASPVGVAVAPSVGASVAPGAAGVGVASPPQAKITARRVKQIPVTKNLALFAANNPHLLLAFGFNGGDAQVVRI